MHITILKQLRLKPLIAALHIRYWLLLFPVLGHTLYSFPTFSHLARNRFISFLFFTYVFIRLLPKAAKKISHYRWWLFFFKFLMCKPSETTFCHMEKKQKPLNISAATFIWALPSMCFFFGGASQCLTIQDFATLFRISWLSLY